jgi:hypothetical protein
MRKILIAAVGLFASISIVAAPAQAATTLGSSATAMVGDCGDGVVAWGTDPAFTVPAGGGVITSMATTAPAGGQISFKVVRGTTIIAASGLIPVVASTNRVAMHVPVTGGEFIGMWTGNANCAVSSSGNIAGTAAASDPPAGTTLTGVTTSSSATLAVEATLEPDADHDGFGDESEDSCPADAAIHSGSCVVDVGVTQTVVPARIGVGDVAVATVTVTNGSTGTATGLALGATLTPGLKLVSTIPSAGCAFTPALSCPLGALAGGGNTVAALVVQGVKPGSETITSGSSTSSTDPNAANNTATSKVAVERRVALVCTVPKLTGLTKAFAKTLLQAVHCKLGKVTKKASAKGKAGTVIKQSKKPKTKLKAGSRVNVTLKG